ncbi:uncharacterized protein LOC143461071 [Clavelina lepadiformis]|uniref:uncharacterized protein LOC143461071 n=1 Tax=Clavelina lepadiformis TaxID=159417 RepID=UPI00404265A6
MVSLCLTKPHIDGTVSRAVSLATTLSPERDNEISPNSIDFNSDSTSAGSSLPSFDQVIVQGATQDISEVGQVRTGEVPFADGGSLSRKNIDFHSQNGKKYKNKHSQSLHFQDSEINPGDKENIWQTSGYRQPEHKTFKLGKEIKRTDEMLSTMSPTGALKNRKMSVKYSSSRLYKQSVMDARKDPYQVHKWRIKSGRMLDKNFLPRPVAKNETKSLRVSLPPLPSKTLSKKRPFLKVAKSFQGRSLETVLEEKERFLVGNRGLREENRDKGQSNETPTILTRLRNRMKLASEVEISQAATIRLEDEENRGRCEIQSGFSDFSTPERMIPPRVAPLNQMQPISKANSIARQKIQRENRDEIRRSSNFVLPPIATSGRRKSYPMRRASNVMEPSRARGKRSQPTKFSQRKILSIPEDDAIQGSRETQRSGHDLRPTMRDCSPPLQDTKFNSVAGSSPTRRHSLAQGVYATVRSGSKEGKEGDTPTDSEGSLGSSKYRRSRLKRGSRMLTKMDTRGSPHFLREFPASRINSLMNKWYIAAKLSMWLSRLHKAHGMVVDDSYNIHSGSNVPGQGGENSAKREILFDLSDYKMKNQLRLSDTTRRILSQPTEKRNDKDINLVQTALRNIKAISDYSTSVQNQIGRHGYFVGFEGKRVIVREGKRPLNYYILLAGSAVVIKSDEFGNTNPVQFMKRGDVFGENEILEDINWQWSVVTSGFCEFLLLERDAYRNIFITGGGGGLLTDPDRGGFLRSISLLQQWPAKVLNDNPNRCLFRYFKRGALLVNDHATSEWIYVVKSGSCSVLKRLMVENLPHEEVLRRAVREQVLHSDIKSTPHLIDKSETVTEADHMNLLAQKEEEQKVKAKEISVYHQLEMSSILKELNPDVIGQSTSPRAEAGDGEERSEMPPSSPRTAAMQQESKTTHRTSRNESGAPAEDISKYVQENGETGFRLSRHSDRHPPRTPSPMKAAYLQTGLSPKSGQSQGDDVDENLAKYNGPPEVIVTDTNDPEENETRPLISPQKQVHINEFLFGQDSPLAATTPAREEKFRHPIHINVRRLTKGGVFGICPVLYADQPSLALVSNGAECLMLNKKFYLDNATEDCMKFLRDVEYPYPSDEELLEQHSRLVTWKAYQAKIVAEFFAHQKLLHDNGPLTAAT